MNHAEYEAASMYIGLPEGAHLTVGDTSSSWLEGD